MADHQNEANQSNQLLDNQNNNNNNNNNNNTRKRRMSWTPDKHQRFVRAVEKVGLDAGPKTILNAMDMEGITVANVSSHLQKFRLQVEEKMKEQNMHATVQGASSSNEFTMQGASSSSASPLHLNHTFGGYENANNSPALTMGKWPTKFSTPYVSVLPCLNQFASDQDNQLTFIRSPVVLERSSMNNNSNREANIETLLKNPAVPLIDLTGDSDSVVQQQNSGINLITRQVMNSNSIPNYSWPNYNPSGAMYMPTSGDGLWGSTQSSATVDKGKNVQEVVLPNPSNENHETGESDGGTKNKPEEETGSSSNSNVKLDICLESLFMEHGMMVSPEWNSFLELGMPGYTQKLNNVQNSSAKETQDDIASYFCD